MSTNTIADAAKAIGKSEEQVKAALDHVQNVADKHGVSVETVLQANGIDVKPAAGSASNEDARKALAIKAAAEALHVEFTGSISNAEQALAFAHHTMMRTKSAMVDGNEVQTWRFIPVVPTKDKATGKVTYQPATSWKSYVRFTIGDLAQNWSDPIRNAFVNMLLDENFKTHEVAEMVLGSDSNANQQLVRRIARADEVAASEANGDAQPTTHTDRFVKYVESQLAIVSGEKSHDKFPGKDFTRARASLRVLMDAFDAEAIKRGNTRPRSGQQGNNPRG